MATSIISRGSDTLDVFARRSTPKIEINLQGQKPGLVNSYTTGDYIEGTANITVDQETRFDEIEIILQGTSHTTVERAACPGRTGSQQMFLKLRQPIEDAEYPTPRIMESGHTYPFAFTFVVPNRLLPQVCSHTKQNDHIHRSHTMLPPTFGDPMAVSDAKTLINDMSPEMSQISYIVSVSVLKRAPHHSSKTLANVAKKVRIIPIVEEEPPLNTVGHTSYCTRKEKTVKRGFLRGKQGQLVASGLQPKPIALLPPSCETQDTVSTVAKVQLRFDPVGDEQPPRLGSMTTKIRASTFYSANPWEDFPCQSGTSVSQVGQGLYTDSIPLSNMCVASAKWEKHSIHDRRDSVNSTSSTSSDSSNDSTGPSASFTGDTFYTASLVIPVSLPKSKTFVPTFHSCLMSRTYSLDWSLSYHTPGANVMTPSISLRLPIQVTTQPRFAEPTKSDLGLVVTQEELNEFFHPRSTSPRSLGLASTDSTVDLTAPPEYSEAMSRPRRRRVPAPQ
ncbi:hypothetical protein N7454_010389 [Penicillium verhagenii]|nr:hypothetical protein N7454_010389 [Penicillium verhagenii]